MKTQDIPIGAKVTFRMAGKPIVGRIVEDRGPIGRGGRRLYTVRYELGKGNWYTTEMGAAEIEDIEFKPVKLRKMREVQYIIPFETVEAYSLFARPEHAQPLANFLRSQSVRFSEDPEVIYGEVNFQIDRSTPWQEFLTLLNDWKRQYAEG